MSESRVLSEGLLIAAASALAYAVAFAYDAGYAEYFGIPPLFSSPTLGDVLKAAGAVSLALLSFWNIASGIWPFLPRGTTARDRAIWSILVFALTAGLFIFYILDGRSAWITLAIVVGIFGFLEFVFPLIVNRKIAGYENKLLAQEAIEQNAQKYTLLEKAAGIVGEGRLWLLALVGLLLFMAHGIGFKAAKNQEVFYALVDRPNTVVLSMHETVLILGTYDPTTLTLSGSYVVEQLSDAHQWTLERRQLGKLKRPSKPSTPTASNP
ncbi:MAG: hypothetical protein H6971_10375 [Gammaproteobacteria bacterium]|nr:hypothetical protein [Gammaproteobacteria bacterium]